ncbi:hypothetical protein B7P33_03125 [Sediminicola luteus]|uniref:Uncharacterized protein n=1 Tax=Sediminicola luteus TaxID=319238 RepID=A0A2A4GEA1_9FLAO|nr:hypothetical protein B7P33_03125 [Sediminicola luteus]
MPAPEAPFPIVIGTPKGEFIHDVLGVTPPIVRVGLYAANPRHFVPQGCGFSAAIPNPLWVMI